MSLHLFSRPDLYIARCGRLNAFVREHQLDGAPAFMRGLRTVFVSDIHVLKRTTDADIAALIDRIAACEPDLLLLGGDYGDAPEDAQRFLKAVSALKPPLGAFGVIGNNDAEAWEGRLDALCAISRRSGVEMLINGSAHFRLSGGQIWVAGVDEYKHGRPNASGLLPKRSAPNIYRILLSHYPVLPERMPDLMLCGHTHGGQFNLLGLTPYSIGFERFYGPHLSVTAVSGLRDIRGAKLLVSKGIGASRLQLRVGARPEIDVIKFA